MSLPSEWTIICRRDLAPEGTVSIGEQTTWWTEHPGARVRLESGRDQEFLQSISRRAGGNVVYVHPGAFGMFEKQERTGSITISTRVAEHRHWLLHTTDGRITVTGLGLAVLAELVKAALVIGEHRPFIEMSQGGVAALEALAAVLTIAGLFLVAWKGVLTAR